MRYILLCGILIFLASCGDDPANDRRPKFRQGDIVENILTKVNGMIMTINCDHNRCRYNVKVRTKDNSVKIIDNSVKIIYNVQEFELIKK